MQDDYNNRYVHTGPYLKEPIEYIPESKLIREYTETYALVLSDMETGIYYYYPNDVKTRIIAIKGK